jgi:hypothetical protein
MARHTNPILGYGISYSVGRNVRKKSGRKFSVLLVEVGYIFTSFLEHIFKRVRQIAKSDF